MKNLAYTEKIIELICNIDFDTTTRRLLEDYITYEYKNAPEIFKLIKHAQEKNSEIIPPEMVEHIFIGSADDTLAQNMCYKYTKNLSQLEYIYLEYGKPDSKYNNIAYIPNPDNFVRQFLNLARAFGIKFIEGQPKNPAKYHFLISLSGGKCYHVTYKNSASMSYFSTLANRYFSYNLNVFYCKILKHKTVEKLNMLANTTPLSQKLYKITKGVFDDFDFIYAVMAYLEKNKDCELFDMCISKNESYLSHNRMDNILDYIDTASSLKKYGHPEKVVFLQDITKNRKISEKFITNSLDGLIIE